MSKSLTSWTPHPRRRGDPGEGQNRAGSQKKKKKGFTTVVQVPDLREVYI